MAKINSEELYHLLLKLNVMGHHAKTLIRRVERYPNIRVDDIIREFCMINDEDAAYVVSKITQKPYIKLDEIEDCDLDDFAEIIPDSSSAVPFKIDKDTVHYITEHPNSNESANFANRLFSTHSNKKTKAYIGSIKTRNILFKRIISHFFKTNKLFENIKYAEDILKKSNVDDKKVNAALLDVLNEVLKVSIFQDASDIQFMATDLFGVVQLKVGGTGKILAEFDRKLYDRIMNKMITDIKVSTDSLKKRSVEAEFSKYEGLDSEIFKICSFRCQFTNTEAKSGKDKIACTIRIVLHEQPNISFEDAGFSIGQIKKMNDAVNLVSGLILLIGPVNQGKSTTLYSMMNKIDAHQRLVKTIENPIEKRNPWWEQNELSDGGAIDNVEEETQAYRNQIKSMVRKSPDCLLAGELRSAEETEKIFGLAYASTLCFSTIHSENISAAIGRLAYWQLSKYDLASVLRLLVAQRLLRKLCPKCKVVEDNTDNLEELKKYETKHKGDDSKSFTFGGFFKTLEKKQIIYTENISGCENCDFTGFKGRALIAEMLSYNDENFKNMILSENHNVIQDYMINKGISLWDSGMNLVQKGEVSINEVVRNTQRLTG